MSDQCIGEIRMFGGNYAPVGWAFCNGQLLRIADNEPLYTLLGTTYGGDGVNTFGLPDLQGRLPIHQGRLNTGNSYVMGEKAGAESVTLTVNQMPQHTHTVTAESTAGVGTPEGNTWALQPQSAYTTSLNNLVTMSSSAVSSVGSGQPHDNMMPSLTISFIIALEGIFPSRS